MKIEETNVMGINETTALRYRINECLLENEKGETDALMNYAELLRDLTEWHMSTSDEAVQEIILRGIDIVREISSDEKNHRLLLQSLQNDLDKIPITPDGMTTALGNIVAMVANADS